MPYSLQEKAEEEPSRLAQEGTVGPVEHADWASPIVAILLKQEKMHV